MLTATVINDKARGWYTRLRRVNGIHSGERYYLVRTHDEGAALKAAGVPVNGEAWSQDLPTLLCRGIESEYWGGSDSTQTDGSIGGGATILRASYFEPDGRGRLPLPQVGSTWTEPLPSVQTIQRYFAIPTFGPGGVGPPYLKPIAGGQGVPIEVPQLVFKVHTFQRVTEAFNLAAYFAISGTTNKRPVELPPLFGTGPTVSLAKGQGLYRFPVASVNGSLLEIVHEIVAARDFLARSAVEGPDGAATGEVDEAAVYDEAEWPAF